jgi:hypothetical protein
LTIPLDAEGALIDFPYFNYKNFGRHALCSMAANWKSLLKLYKPRAFILFPKSVSMLLLDNHVEVDYMK